jgi:hypothetical protein
MVRAMSAYPKAYYTLGPLAKKIWREPWLRNSMIHRINLPMRRKLRKALDASGLISPHFTWSTAACHDGTPVPQRLRGNATRQAWRLEEFRHALGDKPVPILSWYRTPAYNRKIGGATQSQHMQATATDFDREFVDRVGRSRFFALANKFWKNDGVGDYPSGSAHTDVRGFRARWTSF